MGFLFPLSFFCGACLSLTCAFSVWRTGASTIQAVLVDLKGLPSVSAMELASSIRNTPNLKALPVLALPCPGLSPSAEKDLKNSGVSFIINKPLRYSTLASVLHEAIGLTQKATPKKKAVDNVKLLTGKRCLVVSLPHINPKHLHSMLLLHKCLS